MLFRKIRKEEDYYLKKAILGEREGFEYLVDTYRNLAYTVAFKICGNRENAEEVVQDAFMKAFNALATFRSAAKFSTWLYKIVYHTALTKKSSRCMDSVELNDESGDLVYVLDEKKEFNGLFQADRKEYINLGLAQLVEEERIVVTLHYLGEKSIAEIAEILEIGKSAIKMRLMRGRRKLEESLKGLLKEELKDLL
ncbi:RNA polymerase sigma factor [Sphingobacterium sp. SRCM116780]|uniref:RNA polymerase sigma factor n=1 Tax=Sphingobacterium sp. SRCM116780 TaxID=2907623 RepID=UPI001F2C4A33|nr:RNA polymerase sigma factor [Sphingobacterium sp. SRCM116780]UIR56660.1 RNA polymerase sigma factor [Sphingobacterium sp. SRCM116780]